MYSGGCAIKIFPLSINSGICLKKKVNNSVLICAPSTSASVIMTIFPYLSFSGSNSSIPMPVPIALMRVLISSLFSIFSTLAFSTFSITPLSGRIAWCLLSLPCFAVPPADIPSTINSSVDSTSLLEQSASFPGKSDPESAPFLLVSSLAFLAASLALDASSAFPTIALADLGFSSQYILKDSYANASTNP